MIFPSERQQQQQQKSWKEEEDTDGGGCLVNMYLFAVASMNGTCLFLELAGKRRLFCYMVVIAVPVRSTLCLQN